MVDQMAILCCINAWQGVAAELFKTRDHRSAARQGGIGRSFKDLWTVIKLQKWGLMFVEMLHVRDVLTGRYLYCMACAWYRNLAFAVSFDGPPYVLVYGHIEDQSQPGSHGSLQENTLFTMNVRYLNCYKINVYLKLQLILEHYFYS